MTTDEKANAFSTFKKTFIITTLDYNRQMRDKHSHNEFTYPFIIY